MTSKLPIALIEEDPVQRAASVAMLSGFEEVNLVGVYENTELALSLLRSEVPRIVVMGISGSVRSTGEGILSLKEAIPGLRILIVASTASSFGAFEALTSGASGYLLRTDLPSRLYGALGDLLRGGYPISSLVARNTLMPVLQAYDQGPKGEYSLSKRELDCLRLVSRGMLTKEIAEELDVGIETVRTHMRRLYKKLDVRTRAEATVKYLAAQTKIKNLEERLSERDD